MLGLWLRMHRLNIRVAASCFALMLAIPIRSLHAQAPAGLVRISLPAMVQVGQSEVHLGDIASLASHDLITLRRLMDLPLGHAPLAGRSFVLERDVLARWIRGHAGIQGAQISWQGSAFTEISLRSREISGGDIAVIAEKGLKSQLSSQLPVGSRIELQSATTPQNLVLADETVELKLRSMGVQALTPRMTVWVDIVSSGRVRRSVAVVFEVAVYGPVVIAARDIPAGASLLAGDVQVRDQNIAAAPPLQKIQVQAVADGQRLRRPIRAGEILTPAHTEAMPDVARGSWATLETRQGGLNVQSRAEVLQDGRAGQLVHVKPVNASASLLARVAGPGRVEMYP